MKLLKLGKILHGVIYKPTHKGFSLKNNKKAKKYYSLKIIREGGVQQKDVLVENEKPVIQPDQA